VTVAETEKKSRYSTRKVEWVTIGDDLGKCFGIKNIYFDFDKSNIRVEAALDLEKY
jgi:outer membrane protein OmpA-like peptidoglycan-associated protein